MAGSKPCHGELELGASQSQPRAPGLKARIVKAVLAGTEFKPPEARMEQVINNLLGRYERGALSRRDLVGALAVGESSDP